jgi:hypothetical protein
MSEVLDLNELVQSVKFTVLEKTYEIAPMNDVKMKKVMDLSKKISELSSDDKMSDEQEAELLDTQNTILHNCVSLNTNDNLTQIDKKDFSLWPMKLKNKVLELVFNQIGGGVEGEAEKN